MLVLSVIHVYLIPAFVLLTFIVNMTIKYCIDGEFRSSTYTEKTFQLLLTTIYPITTKRKEGEITSGRENKRERQQKQKVFIVKDSLGELKYYYIINLIIIVATYALYKIMNSYSKEFQLQHIKLHVPLNVWVHTVSPILFVGSIVLRAWHHKTDAWKMVKDSTLGKELKNLICTCKTTRPKSSFTVEEDENMFELHETEREDEEEINDQLKGKKEQEIKGPNLNLEEINEEISNTSDGLSNKEVVIEYSEILAKVKEEKEKFK